MDNTNESNLAEGIGYQPGELIGRYEVITRIAIGGQSIIYKCHDPALDRLVAIKQISTHLAEDKMFLDRFRTEAQILARLGAEQPEVVTIHDLLDNKQGLFIVMEFVEGISIERTLASNPGPVELKATLQILWRLCSALHTVHAAGVIHRDIKPSNIIIADGLRPMITDFGVAATSAGEASMVMGTTKYMAPELFSGDYVDGRADMYSLGFVAYEMLVGREKFNEIFSDIVRDRTTEKVRWMKWHSNPKVSAPPLHTVNPDVPIALSNIVVRMTAKDSEQRFAGMEDLGRAIKQTFRPGAKASGGSVPVAQPIGGGAMSDDQGSERTPFETEDAVTAPIPKRALSLRAKISMALAASVLIFGGVIAVAILSGRGGVDIDAAKRAYDSAREAYKSDRDYAKAEEHFLAIRKDFGETRYSDPSQVYIHMCRTQLAITARDWARAQKEQDAAADLRLKIQKRSGSNKKLYKWTVEVKGSIRALESLRIDRKAFCEEMANARRLFDNGKYDEAVAGLDDKYDEPERLQDDQQEELAKFKDKVARKVSNDECDMLMNEARAADQSDIGAALAAWEKASDGLQRLKSYIEETRWKKLDSEVKMSRAKLVKDKGLIDLLAIVDNARQSGDSDRLLRALRNAMVKSGVPPKLVERWGTEIKEIQEKVDFAKITGFLSGGDSQGAIDALDVFIAKYPGNRKAKALKTGLEKKLAKAQARKDAFRLFDRGRWAEALEKLEELRIQDRGDRDIKEKLTHCKYMLKLVEFDAAVAVGDYTKAEAAGAQLQVLKPDKWDSVIAPKLADMRARRKVAETLKKGKAALDNAQYSEVRKILKNLKDSNPEAQEMIRKSKYLESISKGDAARKDKDFVTALAMYKIAKNYAKGADEHKKIDALIEVTASDGS
jgi:tRNA A-37 threonylcarbamoyl transferase component Bud32